VTHTRALKATISREHASFRLVARRSRIHRVGVFAAERIPRGRKVIEFTGERINFNEARRRWSPALNYMFSLDNNLIIDGAVGGSGAEYINHSCAPNLSARILRGHLLYFSTRGIGKGEELTVDYKYAGGGTQAHPCNCGAATCRGTMILAHRDTRAGRAPRRPASQRVRAS
jgi:SET domain-containing protein